MKKILLATFSIEEKSRFDHDHNSAYSIGLCYLYSVLEKNGYEVKLQFLNNNPFNIAEEVFFYCLDEWKPEVVAFQIFSMTRVATYKIIEKIQQNYPELYIIIGGIHTSVMYDQIIRKYTNLIAVIGEGEETLVELLSCIKNRLSLKSVKGIAYFENDELIVTHPRELYFDLDRIPFPKHELFFDNEPNRTVAHIVTSRGCPFNCSFCCLSVISHRKLRKRKIENVIDEIKFLKKKYPRLSHVQLHDDTFLIDNERVILFCKLLLQEKIDITFSCSARVKPVSAEMFSWLEKAGCTKIMFGLETGSEKLLSSIHKNITQNDVIKLFSLLKKYHFTITTFLMCGFPGENEETINETINFVQKIQKIKYSWITGVGKLWVYPGTEVYTIMRSAGYIDDSFWLTDNDVPFYIVENSYEKLVEFENKIMDNVSLERIFTVKGFTHHFLKMPFVILLFLIQNPIHLPRLILSKNKYVFYLLRSIRIKLKNFRKRIF